MDYAAMQKPELVQLCRDRGLTVSGTKEDLAARLEAADEQALDPLADLDWTAAQPEQETGPEASSEPEQASTPTEAPAETPEGHDGAPEAPDDATEQPAPAGPRSTYEHSVLVEGQQIDDAAHRRYLQQAHEAARAAGYHTRGYPYAGHRLRVEHTDAGWSAVYQVSVRRQ